MLASIRDVPVLTDPKLQSQAHSSVHYNFIMCVDNHLHLESDYRCEMDEFMILSEDTYN